MLNTLNFIYWSVIGDPEDLTGDGAGYKPLVNDFGGITGIKSNGDYYFVFQQLGYTVFQYQQGDDPFYFVKEWKIGCNYQRTIVNVHGSIFYVANNGDIHITSGGDDRNITEKRIKTITRNILGGRNVSDYYTASGADCVPNAFYDEYNNAYRLFYAGSSSYNDKCLTYFIDQGLFTTATNIYANASISTFGFDDYICSLGNSDASGITYQLDPVNSDPDKTGTFNIGWLFSDDPEEWVHIRKITIYYHAQKAASSTDNADFNSTISIYDNPETDTVTETFAQAVAYNSVQDNLLKKEFAIEMKAEFLKVVISDSGSKKNYSIDKIFIDVLKVKAQ